MTILHAPPARLDEDWTTFNQRWLVAEISRLRALFDAGDEGGDPGADRAASDATGDAATAEWWAADVPAAGNPAVNGAAELRAPLSAESAPASMESALGAIARAFGLSGFERDVLLVCAAVELDGDFAGLFDGGPTFSTLLSRHPDAHWSALSPAGPLRYWRMIELAAGSRQVTSPLRIDERLLHQIAGVASLDDRLQGWITPLSGVAFMAASLRDAAAGVASALRSAPQGQSARAVQIVSSDAQSGIAAAVEACRQIGVPGWRLHASDLVGAPSDRALLARLWDREFLLGAGLLVITGADDASRAESVSRLLDDVQAPVVVVGPESLSCSRPVPRVHVAPPSRVERQMIWRDALASTDGLDPAAIDESAIDRLAEQFVISEPAIRAIARTVASDVRPVMDWAGDGDDESVTGASEAGIDDLGTGFSARGRASSLVTRLRDACRNQLRARVSGLAETIEPRASWEDLVLPAEQRETLDEIALHVRERATVYGRWGMDRVSARGLGVSALFAGASGTGKTLAAEVLAHELGLDLFRIDLSQVVSKYIGETEKNLARLFDAAEAGGAVLFFDEADALFGKRSEVRDSHDRYANIEVSYLLQRMENYRGLAILATNMKSALDPAFMRRIRFIVDFPFPAFAQRREIWLRAWPSDTPVDPLDAGVLAAMDLVGGSIRNVALHAAFNAAGDRQPVRIEHIARAARREFVKLGRPFTGIGGES